MGVDPQMQSIYICQGEATMHVHSDTICRVLYFACMHGWGGEAPVHGLPCTPLKS